MAHKHLVPVTGDVLALLAEGINPTSLLKPVLLEVDEAPPDPKDFVMQTPEVPVTGNPDVPDHTWMVVSGLRSIGLDVERIEHAEGAAMHGFPPYCIIIFRQPGGPLCTFLVNDNARMAHNFIYAVNTANGDDFNVCQISSVDARFLLRQLDYAVKIVGPKVKQHSPKKGMEIAKKMMADFEKRPVDESADALLPEPLHESPHFDTLKKNRQKLTDEERTIVMAAKAVWHHGPDGKPTPAVWKSVVNGKTWFCSNTHRAYQADKTIKAAIRGFHEVVEPSA